MDDSANPTQLLWPAQLIEQATGIIMNRFDLDAENALKLLRKMSQQAEMQMCFIAQQIIDHHMQAESAEAKRILALAAHEFPELVEPGEQAKKLGPVPQIESSGAPTPDKGLSAAYGLGAVARSRRGRGH